MTDTEIHILKMLCDSETESRVFKHGVTHGTYGKNRMIMFTDELGKKHEVCYRVIQNNEKSN